MKKISKQAIKTAETWAKDFNGPAAVFAKIERAAKAILRQYKAEVPVSITPGWADSVRDHAREEEIDETSRAEVQRAMRKTHKTETKSSAKPPYVLPPDAPNEARIARNAMQSLNNLRAAIERGELLFAVRQAVALGSIAERLHVDVVLKHRRKRGVEALKAKTAERKQAWQAIATRVWNQDPRLSKSAVAEIIKDERGLNESVRTIREAIIEPWNPGKA